MSPAAMDLETASSPGSSRRFGDLRGVQWRIDLGILPSSNSASIDDLRRVTADSRRKYAALRRQLLVDPHVSKEGSTSPDPFMDNPLSQNPDSMWGRFFRNAELERMVDQDLTRLYPEHNSYFQTSGCQGMLRRILLLWCLSHPDYGYRQGMHELLAPLLYVLHVDMERLSEVRGIYEDYFIDKFDGFSFHENDLTYKFDFKKFSESMEDVNGYGRSSIKANSLYELNPKVQSIIFLSDAYGAEGELGVVLSERFMEHDAYCMFEALMSGSGGAVVMAEFFSQSRFSSSHSGFPPVIEASAALYHLLSVVDSSLHVHLVELGVEPQYFALRWLRVLFGREFALEDLLMIWDEIFACENSKFNKSTENDAELSFGVLDSSRGAFITSFAVSMILHLRSSLLATEYATSCLQRLVNFPDDVNLEKLVAKAKSLQALAVDANSSNPLLSHAEMFDRSRSMSVKGHRQSFDLTSLNSLSFVPDSYWEEKWRDLHKEEEHKLVRSEKQTPSPKKGWTEKEKLRLSRTESAPSSSKLRNREKEPKLSVRRNLLDDLSRQLGADEDTQKLVHGGHFNEVEPVEEIVQDGICENYASISGQTSLSGNPGSEENSSIFSDPPSPIAQLNDQGNQLERSSVGSSSSLDENDCDFNRSEICGADIGGSPLPASESPEGVSVELENNENSNEKSMMGLKEQKLVSSKFQWFWKFGRSAGERVSEKGQNTSANSACNGGIVHDYDAGSSIDNGCNSSPEIMGDMMDQNAKFSLRNLGQSMLENIQVIEAVFQQDRAQAGPSKIVLAGKGQATAMAALKELRKISNLLSEM